jgi:DNA-binding NarL/FixJ family response regulator
VFLSTCADIQVVAEAGSGREALRRFMETLPDVVLMDLAAPGMDSPVVTCRMKELHPGARVIALTSEVDPTLEDRALAAGAISLVLKDSSAGALVDAIRETRSREAVGGSPMTFVQSKTGTSAERKTGAPSDVRYGLPEYDWQGERIRNTGDAST